MIMINNNKNVGLAKIQRLRKKLMLHKLNILGTKRYWMICKF